MLNLTITRLINITTALTVSLLAILLLSNFHAQAAADTCTWTNGGGDNTFNDATNWAGCDGAGIPENGDTLVFPTSVNSDTTTGDDRTLNNDISSLSLAGIQVTGTYATGDYDHYTITGNNISLSGDVLGNASSNSFPAINLEVNLTASSAIELLAVKSTGGLTIGTNNVTATDVDFEGGVTGSGNLTIDSNAGGGAGGCLYGTADPPNPFGGDSSGFSGAITVNGDTLEVTSQTTGLARHASSITLAGGSLFLTLNNGADLSFSTPLTLSGGSISARQLPATDECATPASLKTVTISGNVTATAATSVYMDSANVTFSGTVTGASNITVPEGISTKPTLTIGSSVFKSALQTTTYTGDQSSVSLYVAENQLAIIASGATTSSVTVGGGTLKGLGTTGVLEMISGVIAPGLSPGCLSSGNLVYTGGTVEIELAGTTACTQYDQQIVTGTVDLGTATTLNVSRLNNFLPAKGNVFTIINNDGTDAITGNFSGLAEGATLSVAGVVYRVSYIGGSGNDATLTVINVPVAPATGFPMLNTNVLIPIASTVALAVGLLFAKRQLAFKRN